MALPKKAIKILRDVQKCILAEPELYDQNVMPDAHHSCTTPCCIAGWVEWCANPDARAYRRKLKKRGRFCGEEMAETLGISESQARQLYTDATWSWTPAWTQPGTKAAALDGAAHIGRFIKSGGNLL